MAGDTRAVRRGKLWLLLLGALVMVVPFLFLVSHLETLATQEEDTLDAEYRQALLTEQEDLRRDLDPEQFIGRVHEELDLTCGLLSRREGPIHHPAPGTDPGLLGPRFLPSRLASLKDQFGLEPLFLAVADTDCRNVWWMAHQSLRNRISEQDLQTFARLVVRKVGTTTQRWLPTTPRESMDADRLAMELGGMRFSNLFRALTVRIFGNYWNREIIEGRVQQTFSEKTGGLAYLMTRFIFPSPGDLTRTFGGYVAVFLDKTLSRQALLRDALGRSRQQPLVRRIVRWDRSQPTPGFSRVSGHLALTWDLPPVFRSGMAAPGPGQFPVLSVEAIRPPGANQLLQVVTHLRRAGAATLLLVLFPGIWWVRRAGRSNAPIRRKLLGIIAVVVILPVFFLGLLSLRLLQLYEKEIPQRIMKYARNRSRFLALRFRAREMERAVLNMHAKGLFHDLVTGPRAAMLPLLDRVKHRLRDADSVTLVRADGQVACSGTMDKKLQDLHTLLGREIFRGFQQADSAGGGKKDLLSGEFLETFWNLNNVDQFLSQEGLEAKSPFSFREREKMVLFLVPAPGKTGRGVGAAVFLQLHNSQGLRKFASNLYAREFGLFEENHPHASLRFALFEFGQMGGADDSWPTSAMRDEELLEVVGDDARTRSSGSLARTSGAGMAVQVWERVEGSFSLVSGVADIRPLNLAARFGIPCVGFLLVAAFVLNRLMADLLVYFFLDPIETLATAARKIGEGELSIRVTVPTADEFAEVAKAFNSMAEAVQQRERLRRFIPDRLVLQVMNQSPDSRQRTQERIRIAVLVSDIRGFTSLSERHAPEALVESLNDYFTEMEGVITGQGGMILKLIGDAIIAVFFPAPAGNDPVSAAVSAARKMRLRLAAFNESRAAAGLFPIENGIGLAYGMVQTVELGLSGGRRDFTVLGPPLSEAARLESLSAFSLRSRIIGSAEIVARLIPEDVLSQVQAEALLGWEIRET